MDESDAATSAFEGVVRAGGGRRLVVTSAYSEAQLLARVGRPAYSYRMVYRAFRPLLERWAPTAEVDPLKELDRAVTDARSRGDHPVHLSFLPLQDVALNLQATNIGVPAWEYPDIPDEDLGGDPRENWVRRSEDLDLIVTHTQFSRRAFLRAGVRTPVRVVPVPVNPTLFDLPAWELGQKVVIDCPCYVFPQGEQPGRRVGSASLLPQRPDGRLGFLRRAYRLGVKPKLPPRLVHWFSRVNAAIVDGRRAYTGRGSYRPPQVQPRLELEGVVYTSIFNPGDGRKNWTDMLTGFLYALRDRPDATLVFKLVTSPATEADWVRELTLCYRRMQVPHRCKVVFVSAFLSDSQLLDLARASTYYLNSSRAEGSCLPLQDYLAAGRPAVAPPNTGMADSLTADSSFLVQSHPEPCCWAHDPEARLTTTWHRINWQSLYDQLQTSYWTAREAPARWRKMSANARLRMRGLVDPNRVWPLLLQALDEAAARGARRRTEDGPSAASHVKIAA